MASLRTHLQRRSGRHGAGEAPTRGRHGPMPDAMEEISKPMNRVHVRTCLATLLLTVLSLPRMASGDTPPGPEPFAKAKKFLYLAAPRITPPEQVFEEGFAARGTNLDMLDHYTWRYPARSQSDISNSGLLDVYGDEQSAIRAAAVASLASGDTLSGYVYRIRADEHAYNAAIGAQDLLQRMRAAGTYRRSIFDVELLVSSFEADYQYITDRPVGGDRVESAAPFRYRYQGPLAPPQITVSPARLQNTAYVERDSHVSLRPYPIALPPSTPPESSSDSLSFSSRCSDSDDDPAGQDCEGDMLATAGAFGVLSASMVVCLPPYRDKRSTDSAPCPALPGINLSRRARGLRVLLADREF